MARAIPICFSGALIVSLRERVWTSCLKPTMAEMNTIESVVVPETLSPSSAPPSWVKLVCANRDQLRGVAFMDVVEDGSDAFLFMHACQSPQFVFF